MAKKQAPRRRNVKGSHTSAMKRPIKVSRLGYYIIIFGWLTIAVNFLLTFEWADQDAIIARLISTDLDVIAFRGLWLLMPLLFSILGFMVYQREKLLWRAMAEGRRLENEKLTLQASYAKLTKGTGRKDKDLGKGGSIVHMQARGGLNMVSGFLEHQAKKSRDQATADLLREDSRRLKALALLHDNLAGADDHYVANGSSLIRAICDNLAETLGKGRSIKFNLDLNPVRLGPETVVFVSILVSELVSNSLRFAFADITEPEIRVHLSEPEKGKALLRVSDNGHGMPQGLDMNYIDTLGLKIVSQMAKHLDGAMETSPPGGGTSVSVSFPLSHEGKS